LSTDSDISKFAYRYICRYFNKAFLLKLVWIAYSPDLWQHNNEVDQLNKTKSVKQDMKIISKMYWQDMKNFVEQISIKFGGFCLR